MVASAMSAGTLANPVKLVRFLNAATQGLTVDPGLGDIDKLASLGYDFRNIGLNKIQFLTVPWEYDPSDPNRVVWRPEADAMWKAIKFDKPLNNEMTSTAINAEDAPGAKQPKKHAAKDKPSSSSSPSTSSEGADPSQLEPAGICS